MRKIGREERAVVLILYPMMANFVVMGAAMPFVYEPMPGLDLAASGGDRGAGAGATICLMIAYRAGRRRPSRRCSIPRSSGPPPTGALFFGEALEWATLLGTIDHRGLGSLHRLPRGSRRRSPPRRSCARARAWLARRPRAWRRSSSDAARGAPARHHDAAGPGRLMPLHWTPASALSRAARSECSSAW
jgi:hypothetical protein